MQTKITAVKDKINECIATAQRTYNITVPDVQVRFDLTGRAAGQAGRKCGKHYVRFNVNHMRLGGQTWEHLLNGTVPHEIAHIICFANPTLGSGHDAGWKRVCLAIGGNGKRLYSEQDAPEAAAAIRPFVYITTRGHEVRVTKIIHTKIQTRGASYTYRNGKGSINKECKYKFSATA